MANDYDDIETQLRAVIKADSTIVALLGKRLFATDLTVNGTLTDIATSLPYLGSDTIAVNDILRIEDEFVLVTALTGGGTPATVTRGHDVSFGNHTFNTSPTAHSDTTIIGLYDPSVDDESGYDIFEYKDSEVPVITLACESKLPDIYPTMGSFEGQFDTFVEIIAFGSNQKAARLEAKNVMTEFERIIRAEKNKNQPLNAIAHDIDMLGVTTMRVPHPGGNMFAVTMYTHIIVSILSTT